MICYKDMTFCTFYEDCQNRGTCHRPLTPEVRAAAERWMPGTAPICQYSEQPECHVMMKPKYLEGKPRYFKNAVDQVLCTCNAKPEHMGNGTFGTWHRQDCPMYDGDRPEIVKELCAGRTAKGLCKNHIHKEGLCFMHYWKKHNEY